jgi:hypothetical protein
MQLETRYLRLQTPVSLGSRFGEWQVCWLGGLEPRPAILSGDGGEGSSLTALWANDERTRLASTAKIPVLTERAAGLP